MQRAKVRKAEVGGIKFMPRADDILVVKLCDQSFFGAAFQKYFSTFGFDLVLVRVAEQ